MIQLEVMDDVVKNRIKEIRLHKKLTQQNVADKLSVDRTTYTQYEMGKRTPSIEIITKLSMLYGCTTDYLLGRTDDPDYEIRTDLPEVLKKVGWESLEILADAELTPDEVQELVDFAKRWKAKKSSPNSEPQI